jgi:hypothetical protein
VWPARQSHLSQDHHVKRRAVGRRDAWHKTHLGYSLPNGMRVKRVRGCHHAPLSLLH